MTATTRATRTEWVGLALLVLPMLMVSTDVTVLFLALPTLSADLQPTATQALWITHVYGFLIAGFLVTMGRLADRVGPRRLLLTGSTAFAVLSVVAAFAVSAEMLIVARALLGVAGATLMPSLYSLLRMMFHDETQRRFAIAVVFSAFSAGGALGPLLGGVMLEHFWWGSVFLINVPTMLLLVLAGRVLLPEREPGSTGSADLPSVVLSVVGMLAVVYGLQELVAGAGAGLLALVAAGVGVLVLFTRRQRRLRDPLFQLALLEDRRVAGALVALLVSTVGIVGIFYLFTQHLQWVLGYTPLEAGVATLPWIVLNIVGALLAPALAARLGARAVVVGGLGVAIVGAVLVLSSWGALTATVAVVSLGHGAAMALASDLVISSAPVRHAGSAAAAQEVGGELGAALGIAVGGTTGLLAYRASFDPPPGMSEDVAEAARSSVHEGAAVAGDLAEGAVVLETVREAATTGLQAFTGVAGVLLAVAAVVAALGLRPSRT